MPPIPELEAIRKAQILEAALKTISASGYANVTMDDLCRAAGLSKGGLAHYYRSKNELFIAVFKEFFERIFQRSKQTMELNENSVDKLLSFDWLYDRNDPGVNVGYPVLFDCMSLAVREKEYGSLFHDWPFIYIPRHRNGLWITVSGCLKQMSSPVKNSNGILEIPHQLITMILQAESQ